MTREEVLYLAPYIFSLLLSLGILVYTLRHQQVKCAPIFAWAIGGQTITIFGFILEMVSRDLEIKIVWDKFQWLTQALFLVAYFFFVIRFTNHKLRNPKTTWFFLIAVPAIFCLLVLTDGAHHLIYSNPRLIPSEPFPELGYEFTSAIYIYSVYVYGLSLYGIWLLIRCAFQLQFPYRMQFAIIAFGLLIPVAMSVLSLSGYRVTPERDNTPYTFAMSNFIVAVGLFRFRLFDIAPIAREQTFENISDPVVVLDMQDRIVDINSAALEFLKMDSRDVIGQTSGRVFAAWPEITAYLENPAENRSEVSINTADGTLFYDCSISPISNKVNSQIGYIVIAHDITRQKVLENSYRILSEELDLRVKERTKALHETAERYRAVVENQTEFIVRWNPDGTRTFVNEAYCRYFGTTVKQALSTRFLPLIVEEDRPAVEEKMRRLTSGEVNTETDIHRVLKPDGQIGWQEWTDQAIHDQNGRVIEIQSVGRDITARKLAEESLLNQVAFDEVMTRILSRFATCPHDQVDAAIEVGLQEIAEFMGTDYADIFILSKDKSSWMVTHRWGERPKENDSRLAAIQAGKLPWSESRILKGEAICINSLEDYPPEASEDRLFSESEGAKSLVTVPIRGKGQSIFGCFDLISYNHQSNWGESDLTHLKILGDVIANTLERRDAEADLVIAYDTTLEGWAQTLELKDKETEGHSRRVTESTLALAEAMGVPKEDLEHIHRGAILHDIGKLAVPDHILKKEGPLTDEEREIILKHPETAFNLLKQIPYLEKALEIPYCHHEKWDGSGYPRKLKGEEIPLAARIFAVVDVWDALLRDRPYRKGWDKERVIQYIADQSGKYFDPQVVNVFLTLVKKGGI